MSEKKCGYCNKIMKEIRVGATFILAECTTPLCPRKGILVEIKKEQDKDAE